ncbi:MAG: hypothetical protein NTZ33_08320 [Bacteroidetes bacterium]|nr:hypothetical protein [Bacteroidota bacterium]
MEQKIARIISYIFHPLLMPVYTFGILFNVKTYFASVFTSQGKLIIMLFIFIATFIFPAVMTFFLLKLGKISSLQLEKREERTLPFLFSIIFYFGAFYMMRNAGIPAIYYFIMLAATMMVIMALIINFRFKISVHTMAMGALTAILTAVSYRFGIELLLLIVISIILSGLVAFSRLTLHAHRTSEVYSGWLLGFTLMFSLLMLV